MATIDIRDNSVEPITKIIFNDDDGIMEYIQKNSSESFKIIDSVEGASYIYIKDIPNLIKALQKAQELWA